MKKRKKSLGLQLFVFLIIFVLLFSVIGVVVVYLRGIQEQTMFTVPTTTTPNDESATVIPQGNNSNSFTITDTTAENTDGETINLVVGEDGTIVQENAVDTEADTEADAEAEVEAEADAEVDADAETDVEPSQENN